MKVKMDVERMRAVFASPEIAPLLTPENEAYLSVVFEMLEGADEAAVRDDVRTRKVKRKPRPSRIKKGKRK